MAKSEAVGFNGSMTTPTGVKFDVVGFVVGLHMDPVKVPPAFGSRYKKTFLGPGELTGSFHGNVVLNAATTNPLNVGTTDWANFIASCVFTVETGCTITMLIAVHDVEITRENGMLATITASFANNGDPTIVWDET